MFGQIFRRTLILIGYALQTKTTVPSSYALASRTSDRAAIPLLEVAIGVREDFECDFEGVGQVGNTQLYV